ncbi:MAG: hypothetical protein JNM44_01090 [Chitinophagaceae bacterium]|nr:hypothetical protein [Chitinophagaceae bacterium]
MYPLRIILIGLLICSSSRTNAQRLKVYLSGGAAANFNRWRSVPDVTFVEAYPSTTSISPVLGFRLAYQLEPQVQLRAGILFAQRRVSIQYPAYQYLAESQHQAFDLINLRTYSKPWLHLPLQLTFSAGKFFLGAGSGFMAGIFKPEMNESFQWDTPLEASLGIEHKRFLFQLDYVRGLRPIYEAYTIFYKPANSSLFYYNSMLTLSISTRINNPGNRCEGCRNARL